MESIETGLKLAVFILIISLFFALVGFLVRKFFGDSFDKIFVKIAALYKKI